MTATTAPPARIGKAAVGALGMMAVANGAAPEPVVTPTLPLLRRRRGRAGSRRVRPAVARLLTRARRS